LVAALILEKELLEFAFKELDQVGKAGSQPLRDLPVLLILFQNAKELLSHRMLCSVGVQE